jgi:hypothetical protein
MRYRTIATVLAWCFGSSAGAQQLAYNRAYVCGGERLVVTACGNDAEPTCMVMYPDRPRPRGFTIQQTERKRDILTKLSACANGGGSQAQTATSPVTLGRAEWHIVTFDSSKAVLFTEPLVQRGSASPRGWFTQVNMSAMTYKGQDVWFLQHLFAADCAQRAIVALERRIFDGSGRLIGTMRLNEAPVVHPASGRVEADELSLLCGGQTALSRSKPIVADAQGLRSYFQDMAAQIGKTAQMAADYREKSGPPASGRKPAPTRQAAGPAAPGVGYGNWWIANYTQIKALAFQKPLPQRAGAKPRGWFTDVYFEPRDFQGRQYFLVQSLIEADCAANSVTRLSFAYYDLKEQQLLQQEVRAAPTVNPAKDTLAGAQLSLLCGRPYELVMPEPFEGNASALWDFATSIREAEERQRLEKKR